MSVMKADLKVLFYLKRNQKVKSGLSPVMGRISIGRTMAQFSLKLGADASLWDTNAGRMTGKSHQALDVNRRIEHTNLLIHSRYREIKENQGEATAWQVRNAALGMAETQDMVLQHFSKMNETFSQRVGVDRAAGSYKHYQNSYCTLQSFLRGKYQLTDISFRALNYAFIEDYHFYLRVEKKYKPATAKMCIAYLRKVVRDAIRQGILSKDPFFGFKTEKIESVHKSLTSEELEKILSLELPDESTLCISRDMFAFACFTGLCYIDVRQLKAAEIIKEEDGSRWIVSRRQKTGTPFSVRLMDIPLSILERYEGTGSGGSVFPIPSARRVYDDLKIIAGKCEISKSISFHCGRHTFASLVTLSEGVPIETVSRMLGHKDIKTTQIYAELSLDKIASDIELLAKRIEGKYTLID
jgi:integrase